MCARWMEKEEGCVTKGGKEEGFCAWVCVRKLERGLSNDDLENANWGTCACALDHSINQYQNQQVKKINTLQKYLCLMRN